MSDERLINLEFKIAHQEKQLEDFSDVLYKQQQTIDNLEILLQGITKRLQDVLGHEESDIRGHEKPPHY